MPRSSSNYRPYDKGRHSQIEDDSNLMMMMMMTMHPTAPSLLLSTAILLTVLAPLAVDSYPTNRDRIPNGYNVPDPCRPGRTAQWTSALCNADSDGDGIANGVELGDPSCTWTQGQTPQSTSGITHPGINNDNPGCLVPPWLWKLFLGWTVIFER
ncbi:hypothetical protein EGW08_013699 [Elysia chlorotica]|uniref:Temptin Cys/Cys disulfide domain-containing protein n=1 Tax=Elysia chlorotica TaxID=188477 RepID=A0A433TAC4_ELYCH|nr:hypothetical protein EGW08_013699 [Elysia chlorotica]